MTALAAGAQERYDLGRGGACRPQQVSTRTILTTGRLMLHGSAATEEQMRDFRRYLSNSAVLAEKCLEVDAAGNATRLDVTIRDWVDRRGDRETAVTDRSLAGTTISVTGTGRDRSWRFVGAKPQLSDEALQWLEANFGAEPPVAALVEKLLPGRTVAVGELWEADPAPLLERLWRYPVEKAAGKGTLLNVDGGNARVHYDFTLVSRGMPLGPRDTVIPWVKGGTMRVTLEATLSLRGAPHVLATQYRSWVDGDIDAGLGGAGATVGVDSTLTQLQSVR